MINETSIALKVPFRKFHMNKLNQRNVIEYFKTYEANTQECSYLKHWGLETEIRIR